MYININLYYIFISILYILRTQESSKPKKSPTKSFQKDLQRWALRTFAALTQAPDKGENRTNRSEDTSKQNDLARSGTGNMFLPWKLTCSSKILKCWGHLRQWDVQKNDQNDVTFSCKKKLHHLASNPRCSILMRVLEHLWDDHCNVPSLSLASCLRRYASLFGAKKMNFKLVKTKLAWTTHRLHAEPCLKKKQPSPLAVAENCHLHGWRYKIRARLRTLSPSQPDYQANLRAGTHL